MNSSTHCRSGLSLLEMMIALVLVVILGTSVTLALEGGAGWSGKTSAEDDIADDILRVWRVMNDDLTQSSWWIPDTTQTFGSASLPTDRSLVYAPFVAEPAITGAPTDGQPTSTRMRIFARAQAGDLRFEGPDTSRLNGSGVPGGPGDRLLAPSAFSSTQAYRASYFARSQELVFVRASNQLWNHATDLPNPAQAPSRIQLPVDGYPGTTADWQASANHSRVGALLPSGWQKVGANWTPLSANPYGRVMDACYLYTGSGTLDLKLQLEGTTLPDFQSQDQASVRLYSYALIPSPLAMGVGRLVRAYTTTGTPPPIGSDEGQRIASDGVTSLVIDRVISDNVARVAFETSRHANDLGITNVRATIYFARISEHNRAASVVIRRAVTMVFTMRAANSWQDKATARSTMKTSTVIASGAIPLTY